MYQETISAAVIIVIMGVFLTTEKLAMPMGVMPSLIILLILSFLALTAFILKEKAADEREEVHLQRAGRISFLVGVGVMIVGVAIQALNHNIDPWLVTAIGVMVLTKIVVRIYAHFRL